MLFRNLFVLADSSSSLFYFAESYSKKTMVLGPEQKMPDGNLQFCVIVQFFI